ncbi:hypothetical protein NHX12_028327 [Muraenolepis orangiensis]|uniref:Uncharacterized protein n=1 Tax=Muraenolepis orangiensis TaxID=630683 RepID=A0A9Q0IK67_9TELE|nr:hypothetical protein NHX12_028327 [Muraenolepis orangiensis]
MAGVPLSREGPNDRWRGMGGGGRRLTIDPTHSTTIHPPRGSRIVNTMYPISPRRPGRKRISHPAGSGLSASPPWAPASLNETDEATVLDYNL